MVNLNDKREAQFFLGQYSNLNFRKIVDSTFYQNKSLWFPVLIKYKITLSFEYL